ncbi:hypothetical protein L873DRAFT_1794150 [Choiromyces venosus 120613-1]|uniref:Uncharacterized protein n=1 Tax=Choiromyces venosus 120613-1 TaxID=1336337 RepID=A0A3N4JFH1_9PEZI|nr:hypothetical protein L873DRAFT_1794150 [Choiromyces venosus 120613-1]
MEMVFTGEFPLTLKTDISMPRDSPIPIRYISESHQCRLSNDASQILLASVSAKLHAAIKMLFPGKFPLSSKTDISMPSHSLTPTKYVPEYPRCQPSNSAFHNLLALSSAELQAAMELAFIGEFLLSLKTDISKPRCSPMPIRHVPESP